MEFVSLLSAFGVGAVVSTITQSVLSNRTVKRSRSFNERKEAYFGLFEAISSLQSGSSSAAKVNFDMWVFRCNIVAPKTVRDAINALYGTDIDNNARIEAIEQLKLQIRADLGISS